MSSKVTVFGAIIIDHKFRHSGRRAGYARGRISIRIHTGQAELNRHVCTYSLVNSRHNCVKVTIHPAVITVEHIDLAFNLFIRNILIWCVVKYMNHYRDHQGGRCGGSAASSLSTTRAFRNKCYIYVHANCIVLALPFIE